VTTGLVMLAGSVVRQRVVVRSAAKEISEEMCSAEI